MTRDKIADFLDEAMFYEPADVFDPAIIGVAQRFGGMYVVAYDRSMVIKGFIDSGMTEEEAEEWFEFNTIGAWNGDMTPVFIDTRFAE